MSEDKETKGVNGMASQSFGSFLWDCRLIDKVGWNDEVWTKMRQEYRVRRLEGKEKELYGGTKGYGRGKEWRKEYM